MLDKSFLLYTLEAMRDAVVLADRNRKIISVNRAFERLFGYSKKQVTGKKTSFLYASKITFESTGKDTYNEEAEPGVKSFEVEYRKANDKIFTGRTTANTVKNDQGEVIGYLGIIRDTTISKKRKQELAHLTEQLHLLVDVTTNTEEGIDAKIEKALKLTTNFLDMEIGIVSSIEDDKYTIEYFYPEDSGLSKGDEFELANTYCSIMLDKGDVLGIEDMSQSRHSKHPCYSKFQLNSYIGIPLIIENKVIGTINFSSTKPTEIPFSESDYDMMAILGKWMSSLIVARLSELALIENQEKYKLISERSLDLVCLHKPDGTYEYVSPSSDWILGYKPEELIGTSPYILFHPDDIEKIASESHRQSKEGKRVTTAEYRIRRKDGEYIWFDTSTEPITDSEGNVTALQTSSREITDKKRLEILYDQSQRMANVGGWEYDLNTGKLYWTDEVYRIHEKDPTEEVFVEEGLSYYPDDGTRDILQKALEETIETGKPIDLELPFITEKKNHRFVRTIIHAYQEGKKTYKLYGTFQDITDKKKIENLFNESQSIAKVGGWEFELDSGKLFWTDEVYRIHGKDPSEEVFVEEGISYFPEEDGSRQRLQEAIDHAIETGEPYDLELSFISAKKEKKYVRAIGHALISNNKAYKLYGTFQDITEQKQNELELQEANKQLNNLIETNHQINSIIGHDLKSPLSSIVGLTDLLLLTTSDADELDVEEVRESLQLIYRSSKNMARLLDDLFKWSRVQTGQIKVVREEQNIKSLIQPTIDMLNSTATFKEVDLVFNCDDNLTFEIDRTILPTIIRNFVSNAIKFSLDGDTIEVKCYQNGEELKISVRDEGAGMTEEVLESLFHPTKHPSKTGTNNEMGTGLGLRLSNKLAELHGGKIEVSSKEGKGSVFTLILPK